MNDTDAVETIPDVAHAQVADDYLAVVARAVFQTGVSWRQIAAHWGAYVRAFSGFDCARVAAFGEIDIEGVLATPGVLKSPRKVRAVVANARALMELETAPGGIRGYLRSFSDYAALAKDFKKRFSFMGDMNVWYVLFRVGEPVPDFEQWVQTIPGDHPRMREMVERAANTGRA